jgi:hypothetical protein
VAPQGKGPSGYFLPAVLVGLRREHCANRQLHRPGRKVEAKLALERTTALIEYFETHPCVDRGEIDPIVLEFDHVQDKAFTTGSWRPRTRWSRILEEIKKCEVVCANCHRRRAAAGGAPSVRC